MDFIEIDTSQSDVKWNMTFLHSHQYYEIYFLISGTRRIFLKDKLYDLTAPGIIVIPPYAMHKTEGEAFMRTNLCISPEHLSQYERTVLERLACRVIKPEKDGFAKFKHLLELAGALKDEAHPYSDERLRSVLSYIVLELDMLPDECMPGDEDITTPHDDIFSLIDYLNRNYRKDCSLAELSRVFFLSKTTLCARFKHVMHCSINDYILKHRINRAKELLMKTTMSVEDVARESGFSSANYMGIVFKNKLGVSPLQFKKQNEMREGKDRTAIKRRTTPKSDTKEISN